MNRERRESLCDSGVLIGMLLLAAMALLPLLGIEATLWMRVVYSTGALLVLLSRLMATGAPAGASLTLKRLYRLRVAAAVLFVVSAVLLFLPAYATGRDSLAFLLAGAVMQVYVDYRLKS